MDFNNFDELKSNGFKGFKSINDLRRDASVIPRIKGVYLVLRTDFKSPIFSNPGSGGFFKGKDPNVDINTLIDNWVDNSRVVYIGKAGSLIGAATLYSRISQYLRFGNGKNIGHYGGRYIWQIKNYPELVFCWKETPNDDPRIFEKNLIQVFKQEFGKRPFANLTG